MDMMRTDPTVIRFIDRMGFAAEEHRLPRIAGRILALLLLEDGPHALDDIARQLHVSRASVSTNARRLQAMHLIERVSRPGSRRAHYQIAPNPGRALLADTARLLHDQERMIAEVRRDLGGRPAARARLRHLERSYRAVGLGIERALRDVAPPAAARAAGRPVRSSS